MLASQAAIRKIREACGNVGDGASVLATYLALTEIASDKESDSFQTTQEYIGGKACLSARTIGDKLKVLVEAGLVKVTIPNLRSPGTYELIPFGNGCGTSGNKLGTFGKRPKRPSLPTLEEQEKNPTEEQEKKALVKSEREAMQKHGLTTEQWNALTFGEKTRRMM